MARGASLKKSVGAPWMLKPPRYPPFLSARKKGLVFSSASDASFGYTRQP
jgi:hypothetical protein